MATVTSKQWWVNGRDLLHGLAVAALTAPADILYNGIASGNWHPNWTEIWHVAVVGGFGYLLKKFATPSQTITTNVSATPPAAK